MKDTSKQMMYQYMTGVNIQEEYRKEEARSVGYVGEFRVFSELLNDDFLPVKYLMNVELPVSDSRKTEIDLLMIHQTGIYVFEIKNYKGTIYGNAADERWTQYFRVAKNQTFRNPLRQNEYHIAAIKKIIPDAVIIPIVVFTNSECSLKVKNVDEGSLVTLENLNITVYRKMREATRAYSDKKVEEIFAALLPYSRIGEKTIPVEQGITFSEMINQISRDNAEKNQKREEIIWQYERLKKRNLRVSAGVAAACVLISVGVISSNKKRIQQSANASVRAAYQELETFKKHFQMVEATQRTEYFKMTEIVSVTDVNLQTDAALENTTVLSFTLNALDETYGIVLNENSMLDVMDMEGNVYAFPFWTEQESYDSKKLVYQLINDGRYLWCVSQPSPRIELLGLNPEDITHIKLTNITINSPTNYNQQPFDTGREIEIYSIK